MDLVKLYSLLGGAKEGSEYLDYAIQRVLFRMTKPVPLYSRSLDAALGLVPEGWTIHRLSQLSDCRGGGGGWLAEIYRPADAMIRFPSEQLAVSAPLALCLAAVRARLGLQLEQEEPAQQRSGTM